jgi:hypothetical protein
MVATTPSQPSARVEQSGFAAQGPFDLLTRGSSGKNVEHVSGDQHHIVRRGFFQNPQQLFAVAVKIGNKKKSHVAGLGWSGGGQSGSPIHRIVLVAVSNITPRKTP